MGSNKEVMVMCCIPLKSSYGVALLARVGLQVERRSGVKTIGRECRDEALCHCCDAIGMLL